MRSAQTADSSGDDVLAELQVRLRHRTDSISELGSDPKMKPTNSEVTMSKGRSKSEALPNRLMKRQGGRRAKSKSEKLQIVSEGEDVGRTKWHVRPIESESFDSYDTPAVARIPYSVESRLNTIPPPPKNPPPVLASKTPQGGDPNAKSSVGEGVAQSTTSTTPQGSKQPATTPQGSKQPATTPQGSKQTATSTPQGSKQATISQGSKQTATSTPQGSKPPATSTTPRGSKQHVAKKSDAKNSRTTSKLPEGKSKGSSGVKELAKLFGSRNGGKESGKERRKAGSDKVAGAATESQLTGGEEAVSREQRVSSKVTANGEVMAASGAASENWREGGDSSALATVQDGENKRPVNEASAHVWEREGSSSSLQSNSPYQNVFDDPAFARFDKRQQSVSQTPPPQEGGGDSFKKEKKPKPLPRKVSIGSQMLHCRDESNAGQSSPPTTEATQVRATGPGITISAATSECSQSTQMDRDPHTAVASQLPTLQLQTEAETSSQSTSGDATGAGNETRVLSPGSSSDITSTSPRHPQDKVLKPLEDLESEIDLLAGIARLPPLKEVAAPHKTELSKTKSHNPGGGPITRRTTPKERRVFRHGVRSDGAELDSDEDDYISMQPSHAPRMSTPEPISKNLSPIPVPSSHKHQLSAPEPATLQLPSNPRSSTYYLKILPPLSSAKGPPPLSTLVPPKSPGNDYVDMDTQQLPVPDLESTSLPIHLLHENETRTSAESKTRPTFGSLGKQHINSISRFGPVKYSLVTVNQTGRQIEADVGSDPPPTVNVTSGDPSKDRTLKALNYPKVEIGKADTASPLSGSSETKAATSSLEPLKAELPTFAREVAEPFSKPLPSIPKENIYYMTHKNGKPAPLSSSAPTGRAVRHPYVEIDEEVIEKETRRIRAESTPPNKGPRENLQEPRQTAADIPPEPPRRFASILPPEIPERPEHLWKLAEQTSGEYSYAAIPGQNMFGLQWMNFHARIPRDRVPQWPANVQPKKSSPPRYMADSRLGRDRPPTPPPKSDSLLREQGLIPAYVHTPSPYLIPIPNRKGSIPDLTLVDRTTPPPNSPTPPPRSPKDVIADMRKELLSVREKDRSDRASSPRQDPERSDGNPRRKRRVPPPKPTHPPKISPRKFQKTISTSVLSLSDEHGPSSSRMEDIRLDHSHRQLARQRSQSTGELATRRAPLRQSKSYAPDSRPAVSDDSHLPISQVAVETGSEDSNLAGDTTEHLDGAEGSETRASPQVRPRRRKGAVRGKIDRKSLALIMQNREAIAKQLSLANDQDTTGKQNSQQESAGSPSSEKKALVRGLGEILLELDTLLQNDVCSEEDLVTAIEQLLHIQLQPKLQAEGALRKNSRDESRSGSALPPKPAIEITEGDVEDVVSFVNENRSSSPDLVQKEVNPRRFLSPPPAAAKPRSATVIIKPDSPEENSEGESSGQSENDHANLTRDERLAQSCQPTAKSFVDRDLESPNLESPGSGSERVLDVRSSRSHSAGHKALRRVNAKRRPSNAAEELLSIHGSPSFCNGSGTFGHRGGKLTNVTSGVEIEIPEGAVSRGKKQKVWFDVLQTVYSYSDDEELQRSSSGATESITGVCKVRCHRLVCF